MSQGFTCDEKELERRRLVRMEMKRRHIRRQRIALGAIALVVILILVLILRGCADRRQSQTVEEEIRAAEEAVRTEAVSIKANLAAVGDIMCYQEQLDDAGRDDGTFDFSPAFTAVAPYLQAADVAVGNLELNLAGKDAGYAGYPGFNAPEILAKNLADAGFDILQTANTYSIQYGLNGLNSTINFLMEQKIQPLGTYYAQSAKDDNQGVVVKNVGGIKIAFFAYTKGVNNMVLPEGAEYCVDVLYNDYSSNYSEINREGLLKSVKAAKDLGADVIVAMLHWGSEFEIEPSASQQEVADLLFQNGVDVILGSHSHEVGPMELKTVTVDGEEKNVFVAYSLGNFFSSMDQNTSRESVVLNLEFTMDAETGKTEITNVSYLPLYIVDSGEGAENRYEVLPIRSALQSSLFADMTDTFQQAIRDLKQNTASDFDSGK